MNRGARIARRENTVGPVTARTIRNDLRAEARCQSMVAGQIGCGAASLYAEFLRQTYSFMTACTRRLRDVLCRHGRVRIGVRLYGMDAVAICADWSLPVSLRNSGTVDALLKFLRDLLVALAASERHIELEDW